MSIELLVIKYTILSKFNKNYDKYFNKSISYNKIVQDYVSYI